MKHLMIDLETMGNTSTAAIVAIGVCPFEVDRVGEPAMWVIDLQESLDYGMTVSASTIMWWLEQSDEARLSILQEPNPLLDVLKVIRDCGAEYFWGHGTFDLPILANTYLAVGMRIPWHYRNARDLRTLWHMAGFSKDDRHKPEIEHHAGYDAKAMAMDAGMAMRLLQIK